MSLEYALENYPKKIRLKDGLECFVRPLRKADEKAFGEFHASVPEHERLFVKERIAPELFHQWCERMDLEKNLPLLMIHQGKLIGIATLHQSLGGWKRHIGRVHTLTHLDYRNRGVAKALVAEQILIGRHLALEKLEVELNGEREVTMKDMAMLDFSILARLPGRLKDMDAQYHDYILMGVELVTVEEYAGME